MTWDDYLETFIFVITEVNIFRVNDNYAWVSELYSIKALSVLFIGTLIIFSSLILKHLWPSLVHKALCPTFRLALYDYILLRNISLNSVYIS